MSFGNPNYGLTRTLQGVSYTDAITRITASLKTEGFGVLTEIDVTATLKKKIDVDFGRPYMILGACNPQLAHAALGSKPEIGLFLPCNVTVEAAEDEIGGSIVRFMNPAMMTQMGELGSELIGDSVSVSITLRMATLSF